MREIGGFFGSNHFFWGKLACLICSQWWIRSSWDFFNSPVKRASPTRPVQRRIGSDRSILIALLTIQSMSGSVINSLIQAHLYWMDLYGQDQVRFLPTQRSSSNSLTLPFLSRNKTLDIASKRYKWSSRLKAHIHDQAHMQSPDGELKHDLRDVLFLQTCLFFCIHLPVQEKNQR